jgi:RsiW-degrading membrane proteinase PrsW (M82 family)
MTNPLSPPPGHSQHNVSFSTIMPILGDRAGLARKAHLVPIAATIATALALFAVLNYQLAFIHLSGNVAVNRALQFSWILGGFAAFLMIYYIYRLCGRDRPWWLLAGVFVVMAIGMLGPLGFVAGSYNTLVIGDLKSATPIWRIISAFVGPGLSEELIKALPIIVLALVARYWNNPLAQRIGVFEPLDGILVGVTSAAAFVLTETVGQYFYSSANDTIVDAVKNNPELMQTLVDFCQQHQAPNALACAADLLATGGATFNGLATVVARVLPELAGHIAYSGLFGYFIGLAVLRPSAAPRLFLIGWVTAMALHGAWDAVSFSAPSLGAAITTAILLLIALLSYAYLGSAILKARKMSPTRAQNFATVVVPQVTPSAAAKILPPHTPPVAVPKAPAATSALALKIGPVTRALVAGLQIEPQLLGAAGAGRGKGPIAEIAADADGALGLRNLSTRSYRAKLSAGKTIEVSTGQVVRLSPGLVIDFGGVDGVVQVR